MVDLKVLFGIEPGSMAFDVAQTTDKQMEAADVLIRSHNERAGEEALFRCLTSEKNEDVKTAFFWLGVYIEIISQRYKA